MQDLFQIPIRVYHEDTDGGGIVYYANYLKFMERARTEYLRSLGFEQDALRLQHNCMFVVTHVDISYRQPAKFNDALTATCQLIKMRRASFTVSQDVRLAADATADASAVATAVGSNLQDNLLTASTVSLACLHCDTLAPARIPGALSEALG